MGGRTSVRTTTPSSRWLVRTSSDGGDHCSEDDGYDGDAEAHRADRVCDPVQYALGRTLRMPPEDAQGPYISPSGERPQSTWGQFLRSLAPGRASPACRHMLIPVNALSTSVSVRIIFSPHVCPFEGQRRQQFLAPRILSGNPQPRYGLLRTG